MQSDGADRADATRCVRGYANIFRQPHGHLANAALDGSIDVGFARSGEIEINLSGAHLQFDAGDIHAVKFEITLAGTHLHAQINRHVVGKMQVPGVVGGTEVHVGAVLVDVENTFAVGHVIIDGRVVPLA